MIAGACPKPHPAVRKAGSMFSRSGPLPLIPKEQTDGQSKGIYDTQITKVTASLLSLYHG